MEIGIDLVDISRFKNLKEHFIKRILTSVEFEEYLKIDEEKKPIFLAERWAVKEAIFKATQDKMYLSYSMLHYDNGKPYILNHDEIKISISHEGNNLIAVALIF